MLRLSLRSSMLVIADSEATKRDLVSRLGIAGDRIRVVYLGVGPEFHPVSDGDEARMRLRLPQRYLIYVGRLEPRKNVKRLIQAYALARRQGVDIPLVLAGQPSWLYRDVLELPRKLGIEEHVLVTGFVPYEDLPAVYSLAVAVLFAPLYEGFGLPVLEAMACGTPVVTSNVSSPPEIAGHAALLVDPLDVEELAAAIVRVADERELRERLAAAGPRRASAFSWARTARETVAVYEEAVA
jgi:glycosyltransferase involved in cell wall biosynthesis